ncbi:C40 family peptidase [Kitasatospora aureofaciens]|uniref:C40 family peptidase n=1 Tax=Kitasatospora aureofaciens TaxID=1894 RepID=UPI001C4376A0|nr:bifunctional lytic transglycosylase/C40 family peptidase [Kitasatospora aureofaciens]MBV6700301.1 C40 family peptidase [Kitasatospora aureofaciens]
MNKLAAGIGAAILAAFVIPLLLVAYVVTSVISGQESATAAGVSTSLTGVPDAYRPWLAKASEACKYPALSPALLAAQLDTESGFNANARSPAGAEGPAQFIPGTWATWGRDDAGDGHPSPFNIADAVMAQGRFMCSLLGDAQSSGIPGDVRGLALAGYNAGWGPVAQHHGIPPYAETQNYVTTILAAVPKFQGGATTATQVTGTGTGPDAVRRAQTQLGLPYSWGGGSPAGPSTGFCDGVNGIRNGVCLAQTTVGWDCSSLVQYAYWPTRQLPRTAAEQYSATSDHPVARANLQPGDLLFWSNAHGIYHVAIYAGNDQMVEAPKTGDVVKVATLDAMPAGDYYGATRP